MTVFGGMGWCRNGVFAKTAVFVLEHHPQGSLDGGPGTVPGMVLGMPWSRS
jgi:hypothetical protein